MENLTGQSFGRYHILEQLGEGGMATVYKALDTVLERNVALKVIRSDQFGSAVLSRMLQRFEREGKALAKLSHPNIVKVIDYGKHEETPYLVMEYLPGGTLKQKLQNKPTNWQDAARSLLPICRALEHAHETGVIHRDIKPSNILFTPTGEPTLTDFGIAKIISGDETTSELTNTGVGIGTPEYMAPEQGAGKVDERSDIYALGVVYYQMVTGRLPFKADTPMAVMIKKTTEPLPRPKQFAPSLPDDVERLLIKALQLDPNNRYSSAKAFCSALERIIEGKPLPKEKSLKEKNLRFALPVILGVAALVGVIGFALFASFIYNKMPANTPTTLEPAVLATLEEQTPTYEPVEDDSLTLEVPNSIETKISAKDDSIFALVPEGEFVMGSDPKDPYFWGAEEPKHTVFLDSFWIHLTEVTNSMYRACVSDGACSPPSKESSRTHDDYFNNESYNDYPVINVTFADASNYCEWIGGRLPTEAEWEKAARGTDGRLFPWGNDEIQDNYANLCDVNCTNLTTPELNLNDGYAEVAPVGSFPAGVSPYGALDMAGNVLEWTSDWYAVDYYKNSPYKKPTGLANGNKHPVRGGSWLNLTDGMRPSARYSKRSNEASDLIGFRCAQDDPFAGATDNPSSTNGIEMILIPGGEFLRSASSDDLAELATLCPNCSLETLMDTQP
ncbi:MAG: SUMF1/EgtB/PvdO family nonheme iron enzyme [Anaerolineales bacterium]|nr:SUMF1/EgtB/PvdO family nonheme iron enzyme [Anaerolineales bacterium]